MRLGIACLLALPIGFNRELQNRKSLGLRTFPLVAMASCGFMLVGQGITVNDPPAVARILQGLITGVGFLGGGAIVKSGLDVHGTATAASIWSTACIGAAVAFDRYEVAIALAIVTFLCLRQLVPLKDALSDTFEVSEDDSAT